jgi:N-methylhydantoinase A
MGSIEASARRNVRIGFDVGGTFTDLILIRGDGGAMIRKVPSSPQNYATAVLHGLRALLRDAEVDAADIAGMVHGTTVATNAILERKGARTGLITTQGFRDVLEIGRLRMPGLYNLDYQRPEPLVPRRLRMEVAERVNARGEAAIPIDSGSLSDAVERLAAAGVTSIAVSLLHAYANPLHEQLVGHAIRAAAPGIHVSLSSDVDPDIGEFERTSTVVANAYVMPVIDRYLNGLRRDLATLGVTADLMVMQSSGGTMTTAAACTLPVAIIESGPAAGVVATAALATRLHEPNTISVDIGGTTAKAAVIENFRVRRTSEFQVGGAISEGSRLNNGGGFAIRAPAIDLAEVGAGGGSMVSVDAVGSLRIGPHSAGADPGPVCYDRGGRVPTVTDACLCLGYLNPTGLPSGLTMAIGKARAAVTAQVAERIGVSLEAACHGIFLLATSSMARAVRAVTIERGRDPRDFAMVAFGGNGPLFAVSIARALEMRRVIVPPTPGVFSAIGLLDAQVERHVSRPYRAPLAAVAPARLLADVEALKRDAAGLLEADGFGDPIAHAVAVDMRYRGQSFPLRIRWSPHWTAASLLAGLAEALAEEHERSYGFRGNPAAAEIVGVISTASIRRGEPPPPVFQAAASAAPGTRRHAYFGKELGFADVAILGRRQLTEAPRAGPLLIEEYDATTLVPPGSTARLDAAANILIDTGA